MRFVKDSLYSWVINKSILIERKNNKQNKNRNKNKDKKINQNKEINQNQNSVIYQNNVKNHETAQWINVKNNKQINKH